MGSRIEQPYFQGLWSTYLSSQGTRSLFCHHGTLESHLTCLCPVLSFVKSVHKKPFLLLFQKAMVIKHKIMFLIHEWGKVLEHCNFRCQEESFSMDGIMRSMHLGVSESQNLFFTACSPLQSLSCESSLVIRKCKASFKYPLQREFGS